MECLQINATLHTQSGGVTITSGSILAFEARRCPVQFTDGGTNVKYEMHYNMLVFRNDQAVRDGNPIDGGIEEFELGHIKSLTENEYKTYTATNVKEWLHDHLEGILGADTVDYHDVATV